jgi:sigma-B regulation protein RsbU (phosphoserine phosphatase)
MGLDSGADDYLIKPVDMGELHARLRAGQRLLDMQEDLFDKNRRITEAFDRLAELYENVDRDLKAAARLQQSLIPERQKTFETGQSSLFLRQSGHVGGDLVGMFAACDDHLGLYSIDVSGHGISSALMTARLAGYLSGSALDQNVALQARPDGSYAPRPPKAVIEDLNALVLDEMETEHYFTMLLAFVNLKTGKVTMAQAGHPHPALQRASGQIEIDGPGGFPVGLIDGATFGEFETVLEPGDRLFLTSDGLVECPLQDGGMLDEDGQKNLMSQLSDVSGPAFFEELMWRLTEVAGGDSFPDDISGVLFEYSGQP